MSCTSTWIAGLVAFELTSIYTTVMSMGVWRDSSVAVVITVENMHNYGSTFFAITKMRMLLDVSVHELQSI